MARQLSASHTHKLVLLTTLLVFSSERHAWSLPGIDILSRPVSEAEVADGAPEGTVFDFILSSEVDPLVFGLTELSGSVYQYAGGFDTRPISADFLQSDSASGIDSWFAMPGQASIAGGGFSLMPGDEAAWFDIVDSGAVSDFHLGRVIVPRDATLDFSGDLYMRGAKGPDIYPFSFQVEQSGTHQWDLSEVAYDVNFRSPPRRETTPDPIPLPTPLPTLPPEDPPATPPASDPLAPRNGVQWERPTEPTLFAATSRAVTETEITAGAPAGTVFELSITTGSDILLVAAENITTPIFNHTSGMDTRPSFSADAALDVDSWISTPGDTAIAGAGFETEFVVNDSGEITIDTGWFDISPDGPQTDFQFAQLTIPENESGVFEGYVALKGNQMPIHEPYQLTVGEDGTWDFLFGTDLIPEQIIEEPVIETPPAEPPSEPTDVEQNEPAEEQQSEPEIHDETPVPIIPVVEDLAEEDPIANEEEVFLDPTVVTHVYEPRIYLIEDGDCYFTHCLVATDGPSSILQYFVNRIPHTELDGISIPVLEERTATWFSSQLDLNNNQGAIPSNLPEPASLVLLSLGSVPLGSYRRRRVNVS